MPMYVYRCNDCEHVFEVRQRMQDEPLQQCPQCETGGLRKVISNVGVVFKGSGFYVTDARKGNIAAKQNGSSATAEAKSEASTTSSDPSQAASDRLTS